MHNTNYFLVSGGSHDTIVHGETGSRVNVFNLEYDNFVPSKGELHIFGDDHGEWLAFETEGWTLEDMDLLAGAVMWYAVRLDHPSMQITTEDPRPDFRLRVVK